MAKSAKRSAPIVEAPETGEPIGIVISNGPREPVEPRFSAYIWAPVPGVDVDAELTAVA
jgi:hypothetical protein